MIQSCWADQEKNPVRIPYRYFPCHTYCAKLTADVYKLAMLHSYLYRTSCYGSFLGCRSQNVFRGSGTTSAERASSADSLSCLPLSREREDLCCYISVTWAVLLLQCLRKERLCANLTGMHKQQQNVKTRAQMNEHPAVKVTVHWMNIVQ